jgi:predicted RNA-binding protein YlqC (UPF0109 family)
MQDKIKEVFNNLLKLIFDVSNLEYDIEPHKYVQNGFIILIKDKQPNLGQIIGKNSTTLQAINKLLAVWSSRNNTFVSVKITKKPNGTT